MQDHDKRYEVKGMEFAELNPAQREAVEDLTDNILLLAPAGTGKTNTLACRIANILTGGRAEPEEILCLTFTNKACREMKERIVLRAGEDGRRVLVRTFHGFCYDVIKTEAKRHSDLFADFTIFDEADCLSIIRDLLSEDWPVRSVQSLIALLKEVRTAYGFQTDDAEADYKAALQKLMDEDPAAVRKLAVTEHYQFYRQLFESWQVWGPTIAARYDARLHDVHGLDFTDLIVQAEALFAQENIAVKWARRFLYINIDEVQDTSELEYRILSRIFGSSRLLLCGDYFQTIYEWRGSHPEVVLRAYQRDWQPRRIVLTENYRSTQILLSASYRWLRRNFPERVSALYPDGIHAVSAEHGLPIILKGAVSFPEEAQWIYYKIQQLPITDYGRVCILTRSNRYNKDLSLYFRNLGCHLPEEERLPFMLLDEIKFFRRQEVKDVLAFLRLVVNPHDAASFVRVLNRFGKGIGPGTIRKISQEAYRRAGIRITDYLDEDARRTGDPFAVLLEAFEAENIVVFDVEATGVDPTRDEIIQIAGLRLGRDGKAKAEFKRLLRAPVARSGTAIVSTRSATRSCSKRARSRRLSCANSAPLPRGPSSSATMLRTTSVSSAASSRASACRRSHTSAITIRSTSSAASIRTCPTTSSNTSESSARSRTAPRTMPWTTSVRRPKSSHMPSRRTSVRMWVSGGSSWRSGRMSLRSSRTASAASGMRRRGCARGNCSPRSSWTSALTRITAGAAKNSASRTCATSSARRAQWTRRRCAHSMP